jgi:hypothetical protein
LHQSSVRALRIFVASSGYGLSAKVNANVMEANMRHLIPETELSQATELLRVRLDRRLVDAWIATHGDAGWLTALFDHLRTRKTPRLFFSPGNIQHIMRRGREIDPEAFARSQRIADEAVNGRVIAASNPLSDRFVTLDRETFDFTSYDHWDNEAIHGLNRLPWHAILARHYWLDQDPMYFNALMREWDYFISKVPPIDEKLLAQMRGIGPPRWGTHPPYYELDVFIRLSNWWWAYWLMLYADEMTPERNAVLLARCLQLFDRVAARGVRIQEHNFTSMQMESIYYWATALPEATGMDVWRHAARNNLEASMARAVAEDGSHWEQSLSYHAGCISWYGNSMLLARRNGQAFATEYADRLLKMGKFLDTLVLPDGNMPLLSDTDRESSWKGALGLLKCLFPEQRFQHHVSPTFGTLWVSDGYEWEPDDAPPAPAPVTVFPDAGLGVARNPDATADSMLILDNGPNAAGHAHMDNLTIHYEAFGQPVLVDPGRWVYSPDPDRNWVCSTHSHNTMFIEDEPITPGHMVEQSLIQTIIATDDPRLTGIEQHVDDGVAWLRTSFRGYSADPGAQMWRTVLFPVEEHTPWLVVIDQFSSSVPHTWTNSWLLPASEPVQHDNDTYAVTLENGLPLRFALASTGQLVLRDDAMFWCANYAEKLPARWLRFSSHEKKGQRAFVFVPGNTDKPAPTVSFRDGRVYFTIGDDSPGRRREIRDPLDF